MEENTSLILMRLQKLECEVSTTSGNANRSIREFKEQIDGHILNLIEKTKIVEWKTLLLEYNTNIDLNLQKAIKIAYEIKCFEKTATDSIKSELDILKTQIPASLKDIIWEDQLGIRNAESERWSYYNCFMCVDESREGDQRAFLKNNGAKKPEKGAEWKFESDDGGQTFFIKNLETGEYLRAIDDQFKDDKRCRKIDLSSPITSINVNEFKWILKSKESGSKFYLTNKKYDEAIETWGHFKENQHQRLFIYDKGTPWFIEKC